MRCTLPSAPKKPTETEQSIASFRRAFDDLFAFVHKRAEEVPYDADPLTIDMLVLSMILEDYKEVIRQRAQDANPPPPAEDANTKQ